MRKIKHLPNVQWEVTSLCNHNCLHCYNYWRKDEELAEALKENKTEGDYLKIAKKIAEQKPVSVVITGGEPFIVFDKIKSSIDYFLQKGIFVSINTNIALLTEDIADFLESRKIGLFVSFPAIDEELCDKITSKSGSLISIVDKLDLAKEKGIKFTTNTVVSNINISNVPNTVEFLINRYELKRLYLTRVGKPINSDTSFDAQMLDVEGVKTLQKMSVELSKKYNIEIDTSCPYTACSLYSKEAFEMYAYKKNCTAGKTSYAVDTFGNVKACPRDSNMYGNILSDDFMNIVNNMNLWNGDEYIPEECKKCSVGKKCGGGCRVDSYPFTGNLCSLDRISDLNNLPIKYSVEKAKHYYEICQKFKVNEKVQFIKDLKCIRISHGRKYIFGTEELTEFITNTPIFSVKSFMERFNEEYDIAITLIQVLLENEIINKVSEEV